MIKTFITLILLLIITNDTSCVDPFKSASPSATLDKCDVCKLLAQSFQKGLERTSRGAFGGGDANWEESKLGSYADSEVRFVEIEEHLCDDLSHGKDACHSVVEESESFLEQWWFNSRKVSPSSLFQYVCVSQLKACCEPYHYGADCVACRGFPNSICSNRGFCVGNGTRTGSGICQCFAGYAGETCDKCDSNYFQNASSSSAQLTCEMCDESCDNQCRDGGPKGCLSCKSGYVWDNDYGCIDIDECQQLTHVNVCTGNTFCVNTEGSYHCYQCDKSCDGCNGDGPDSCVRCANQYVLRDGNCIDVNIEKREIRASVTRYATYFGLCLATCIILRKNIYIASLIGVFVAIYITLAEYTLKEGTSLNWNKMFS